MIRLNGLVNPRAYEDSEWLALFDDLGSYSYERHIFDARQPPEVHRKGWEWTQTIYGLRRLGMVRPEYKAIGIGAGRECVIFWLADRLSKVLATDLYGNEKWSSGGGAEASAGVLDNPQEFSRRPIRKHSLEFSVMDGTDLRGVADEAFDVAWSLSSIEHFGGHTMAAEAVREMARVVRPGGIVVIATEFLLLSEQTHVEYFNRQDIEKHIVSASPNLKLVEPISWELPPVEYIIDSVVCWSGVDRTRRHVVLNDGSYQWTSILLFFRRV